MSERVSNELVKQTFDEVREAGELTEESTRKLYRLFGEALVESLHIIENKSVKKVQSESGRLLYRVSDVCLYPEEKEDVFERDTYTCFLIPRYCTCDTFLQHVVIENDMIMCRHILAVNLCGILDGFQLEEMSNDLFAEEYYKWISLA